MPKYNLERAWKYQQKHKRTRKPWGLLEAIDRARAASIKWDEPVIVIIDFDYQTLQEPARYFDYCTWRDFQNQHMSEHVVRLEITDGKITERF